MSTRIVLIHNVNKASFAKIAAIYESYGLDHQFEIGFVLIAFSTHFVTQNDCTVLHLNVFEIHLLAILVISPNLFRIF